MPGDTRNKRLTVRDRQNALDMTASLDMKGYTQSEIAKMLGVSTSQVCQDLKIIRSRHKQEQKYESRQDQIAEKVSQLRQMRTQLWEAWERSKLDAERRLEEEIIDSECSACDGYGFHKKNGEECKSCNGSGLRPSKMRRMKEIRGQVGDTNILDLIRKNLADERTLLGLDAPMKQDVVTSNVNWDVLLEGVSGESTHQEIEERINRPLLVDTSKSTPSPSPSKSNGSPSDSSPHNPHIIPPFPPSSDRGNGES